MTETELVNAAGNRRRSIVRAIAIRAIVYGLLGLAAAVYVAGFRGIVPTQFTRRDRADRASSTIANAERENRQSQPPSQAEKNDPGWPHWRGLHYDARSADVDLADSWPAEGPPVLWSREIGQGYSSVIAVGNCVYTQTQTLTEQNVVALDADSGETIWEHRYGWPYDPGGMYPGPRATPSWADGRLYVAAPDGLIVCLDAADGREIWSVNVNQKFGGRGTEFGYSCSPLVEDGKVIVPVGGPFASVVALNAATGATAWKSGSAVASYATALPIRFKGHRQVVVFLQNELAGFDLKTGILLWERLYSTGYDEHAAAPLYDEPYLRTMQPFRGGSDLLILQRLDEISGVRGDGIREGEAPAEPTGSSSVTAKPAAQQEPLPPDDHECRPKLLRTDKQMSNDVASSVLVDGYVYGFDLREIQSRRQRPSRGEFRCMDFKTGEVRWSSATIGQATIAVAEGKLFLLNDRGEAILLRVNSERCEELARTEVFRGEICWTAPCLHRGRLCLRSPTKLACLYVGKPENLAIAARQRAKPTSAIPKQREVELNWLLGAERDAAFDLPDAAELTAWYWYCLAAIGASAIFAAVLYGMLRWRSFKSARGIAVVVFYVALLLLGIAATPLANRISGEFVFTWPVALFAAHQIALMCVYRSKQPSAEKGDWLGADRGMSGRKRLVATCMSPFSTPSRNWQGILGAAFLVFACLFYYDLTRRLSLGSAWYFLPTFLAAWPLALPAARRILRPANVLGSMVGATVALSPLEAAHRKGGSSTATPTGSLRPASLWGDIVWLLAAFSLYFWASAGLMLWRSAGGP
jgi:hypothetical protein